MSESFARRRWKLILLLILVAVSIVIVLDRYPLRSRVRQPDQPEFSGSWRLPDAPLTAMTYNIRFGERLDEALSIIRAACGNAVFARGRISSLQAIPNRPGGSFGIWGVAETLGGRFLLGSVHLTHAKSAGGGFAARKREIDTLLKAWHAAGAPAIIAGDFNNTPIAGNYKTLTGSLVDASAGSGATLSSKFPAVRVDYVFASREWKPQAAHTIAATVSDHRPIVVTLSANTATARAVIAWRNRRHV